MKIYLVGGAVRDALLQRPVKERDYVVVGATPDDMLKQGFKPVGKDFPVFLHPKTQEEYALARTERKSGHGYYGFSVYSAPDVTLEDDLVRRDLTINAMAETPTGEIIDPYGGQQDLANKYLRHISSAFAEDPVRILRVARFAARYHPLGFRVHPDTMKLMLAMVREGEVDYLVSERVWAECDKTLGEDNPQIFFKVLRECGALKKLFPELDALFGVPNPPKWHPEIDSGVHTLMVLKAAVNISDNKAVRFAALVHDLGKAITPKNKWPSQHGHDALGVDLVKQLCSRLKIPNDYRDIAILVTRYHILFHKCFELRAGTILEVLEGCDAFRREERFTQILQASTADALGREGATLKDYPQADYLLTLLEAAKSVDIQAIIQAGYKNEAIKTQLRQARIKAIKQVQKSQ